MKTTFKCLLLPVLAALLLPLFASAAVTVENVTAKQRYPWNGKVDISYTVSGEPPAALLPLTSLKVTAKDSETGTSYSVSSLTGDISTAAGTHSIVWDAAADLGELHSASMIVSVNIRLKGQLWAGGPIWAEKNIGAENSWDSGYYFWWGDTIGYTNENRTWASSDGLSQNLMFISDDFCQQTINKNNSTLRREGWITADGVLAPANDAAQAHWGDSWRMPTESEVDALNTYCDWTWVSTNNVNGYIVSGRGDFADAIIFLPATGRADAMWIIGAGSSGYYWSSVPSSNNSFAARYLDFDSGNHGVSDFNRSYGMVIRPVQGVSE